MHSGAWQATGHRVERIRHNSAKKPPPPKYSQLCPVASWKYVFLASLVAQTVKNLPVLQETWFRSLDWEDPLEKGTATYSRILAWKIPRTGEPGGLQAMGLQRVGHDRATCTFTLSFLDNSTGKESVCNSGDPGSILGSGRSTGEGTGYPLQHSWASLVAQLVKNPPAMRETCIWSLGWEDALEKGKATHSSILGWRIPWTG